MLKTEIHAGVALATLDRPSALNTLNLELCQRLLTSLEMWMRDPSIAVIVLRGAGPKAFCAGGDVKQVASEALAGNAKLGIDFFAAEYRLDYAIHDSRKPIVVIAHGYTMGGGIGLMAGAACRVVTTSTQLSMPELAIGLFPDVGGSYFLQDPPGRLGLFLALTGARLNATDALFAKLADHFIPDARIEEFLKTLCASHWEEGTSTETADVNRRKLKSLASAISESARGELPPAQWEPRLDAIGELLRGTDAHACFKRLTAAATQSEDPVLRAAAQSFVKGSPTSAFLIWEQLRRGQPLSLESCLRMELDLAVQCLKGHDFREGVRALLIDKDHQPRWQPSKLEAVTAELVEAHFQSEWPAASHPLADL